jgi:iron complex outermembrane recepter protein
MFISRKLLFFYIVLFLPMWASAQLLEEVVVTAQKREQNLQDVPISIIAISGENLRAGGVSRLEDMSASVPNFSFAESVSGSDNIFMRGIGSGINYGFEQAVGQVIDGFFYGRSRFGRAAFLDVERVEILKGPQGALIGKNTSAGAINITTAKPTDEFEAWGTGTWEVEGAEGFNFEGAVSGPMTDNLKGRLALRYDGREGWVNNEFNGDDEQELNDYTLRTTLVWDVSETFDATLMYQRGEFNHDGRSSQLSECGAPLRNFDPDGPGPAPAGALFNGALVANGEDCTANYSHNVVNFRNGQPAIQQFDTEFNTANLTLNWSVLSDHTLTSLTGYSDYNTLDDLDADFTFAPIADVLATEDYEQWSQELRLTSPIGDRFDYILGTFFQFTEHKVNFRRDFIALPPPLTPSGNLISTDQDSDTYAVFGQFTWHINEEWNLTVSGRYTHEEKNAIQTQTPTTLFTNSAVTLIPPVGPSAAIHNITGKRKENNFSPTANLQWLPNDDTMLYASVARGFKGGGFDMQNDGPQAVAAGKYEFEDEDVTSYEVGAKLTLLGGSAQLNINWFRSEFDNLQVSTIDTASLTFNVGNAASAVTTGVEADFNWAITEQFRLNAAIAYLDSEYDSFPDAPCHVGLILSGMCTGPGATTDLSNETLPYAPDVSATVSGEYIWPISSALELTTFVQVSYSDDVALILDLDPNAIQKSFAKVDARLTLSNPDHSWEVSLIGRNLNDELTRSFTNDALGGPFMAGSYFSMVDAPRSIALQGSFRF